MEAYGALVDFGDGDAAPAQSAVALVVGRLLLLLGLVLLLFARVVGPDVELNAVLESFRAVGANSSIASTVVEERQRNR